MGNFSIINDIALLLERDVFGSTILFGMFIVGFLIIILVVARSFAEVALMIPFPVIIALAEAAIIPGWIKPLAYLLAGFYLAIIILILTGLIRK